MIDDWIDEYDDEYDDEDLELGHISELYCEINKILKRLDSIERRFSTASNVLNVGESMNNYMEKHLKNVKFMHDHDWDGRCWPEEWAEIEGFRNGDMNARIEAFAAIRRAAEVAREYETTTRRIFPGDPVICNASAYAIRRAIRAAIGSEKSH